MGYMAIRDLGNLQIDTSLSLFQGRNPSPDGITNPSTNFGVVNLKSFKLSFDTGTTVDDKPNVSGNTTRLSIGSKKPIPIKLNAKFSRRQDDPSSDEITSQDLRNISFLTHWSRARSIVMMFWMPNDNSTSWLNYGQEKDFFTSQLKTIYDVIWDKNLTTSGDGFGATTYGTNHYRVVMGGAIGNYDACAIPIIITGINVKEEAKSRYINVTIEANLVENEGR